MFENRFDAGRQLADELYRFRPERPVVLALPRGGVAVAYEVAKALGAPLDLVFVRKIGAPFQPEPAIAAVADGQHPEMVINEPVMRGLSISQEFLDQERKQKLSEI